MNERIMHLYSDLLCIVVHPNRFTIMWVAVADPGCFHRGGQGGPATSGWHRNLHYFNIKMWLTIKYWTILVPKTQLNTIHFYLIVIEICKLLYQVILSEYDNFCIINHLQVF